MAVLCAPSRLLPPHADLNNLNEATITFDDWCEIDALIDALQIFSDENKRRAGYWEQQIFEKDLNKITQNPS